MAVLVRLCYKLNVYCM
jgi:hypothetical protein